MNLAEYEGKLSHFNDLLKTRLLGAEVELLEDYAPFREGDRGLVRCTFCSIYDLRVELPVRRGAYTIGVPYRLLKLLARADMKKWRDSA